MRNKLGTRQTYRGFIICHAGMLSHNVDRKASKSNSSIHSRLHEFLDSERGINSGELVELRSSNAGGDLLANVQ